MPPAAIPDASEGRRARQRRQLLADIEAEARRLLEEGGAGNVSMRAIARAVGMGPASLYTYFDSLSKLGGKLFSWRPWVPRISGQAGRHRAPEPRRPMPYPVAGGASPAEERLQSLRGRRRRPQRPALAGSR